MRLDSVDFIRFCYTLCTRGLILLKRFFILSLLGYKFVLYNKEIDERVTSKSNLFVYQLLNINQIVQLRWFFLFSFLKFFIFWSNFESHCFAVL